MFILFRMIPSLNANLHSIQEQNLATLFASNPRKEINCKTAFTKQLTNIKTNDMRRGSLPVGYRHRITDSPKTRFAGKFPAAQYRVRHNYSINHRSSNTEMSHQHVQNMKDVLNSTKYPPVITFTQLRRDSGASKHSLIAGSVNITKPTTVETN